MEKLIIPLIENITSIEHVSEHLNKLTRHSIGNQCWPRFFCDVKTDFAIAHSGGHLFLKYYVKEDEFKSELRAANDHISHDNCVELFIAFGADENYYNIEINCLGSIKLAYGAQRANRSMLPVETIGNIEVFNNLNRNGNNQDGFSWEITLIVPKQVFIFNNIERLSGYNCRANFYKCGDKLSKPHFLSWTVISTSQPDFHQPDFFGEVYLADK